MPSSMELLNKIFQVVDLYLLSTYVY